jgi:hypothetical protein
MKSEGAGFGEHERPFHFPSHSAERTDWYQQSERHMKFGLDHVA